MKEEVKNTPEYEYTCKNLFCKSPIDKPDPALYSTLFCKDCRHFIIDDKFRAKGNRTRGLYKLKIKVTKEYKEEIAYRLSRYIDNPRNDSRVPSIKGFCYMNKISHAHLVDILSSDKDILDTLRQLKDSADFILSERMINKFNPGLIFYLKQLDWRDNPEVVINNNEPPEFNNISDDQLKETVKKMIDKMDKE